MSFLKNSIRHWGYTLPVIIILTVLVSVAGGDAQGQAFESDSEDVVVAAIEVNGNENIETYRIMGAIPFQVGDEITVPDDIRRAEIRLREMGYFEEVAGSFEEAEDGSGIEVVFELFENPVIGEIELSGNRNWNEDKRLEFLGISLPWPFVNYIVTPERIFSILGEYDIKKGEVFNSVQFQEALGINNQGQCLEQGLPNPSICREYKVVKQLPFFGISMAEGGETVRIGVVEGVLEDVVIEGVESPYLEKAEEILSDLPILKPIKIPDLQGAFREIVQSIYFEPLQEGDYGFQFGAGQDRLILTLNLSRNILLEEPQQIDEIAFSGNEVFGDGELSRKVQFEPGVMDNFAALQAIEGVHQFYQKEGYVMAQVTKDSVENNVLTLDINEGLIREIEIRQNSIPTARYTEELTLEPIPLDEELAERVVAERAQAEDDPIFGISDENHPLVVMFSSLSNFLSDVLGTSASSGMPYTQPEIILKEMTLKPGQYLNQFELAETYRRLLGLEYFSDVLFDFQIIEEAEGLKVIVDVQEQDRLGDFRFGGAVSEEGLVGQLSIRSKNLQGTGQDIAVEFDRGILGKAVINWNIGYQNRTILENADYISIDLFNRNSRETSPRPHLLNRLGGEASLAYPIEEIQVVLGFRHELFTKEFAPQTNDQDEPAEGDESEGPEADLPDDDIEVERGTSNVLSLTVNRDNRNNPVFATRGSRQSLSIERAGLLAGSEVFTKVRGAWIQHLPTIEDQTIGARLVGGWGNDLPSQEQFVIGGSTTLRGITPKFTNSMAFMNLEYRILLDQSFSIAFFVDVGTDLVSQEIDLVSLKKSFGIEGRITIPYVGPVRFAFAWPVTDKIEYFKAEFGFGTFF